MWHAVLYIMKAGCHKLFKKIFLAFVLIFCFFIKITGGFSEPVGYTTNGEEAEIKIINVAKNAVEDTRWIHASSRVEMNRVLNDYYTGPLLERFCESAWNFVITPTDWAYTVKAENCTIIHIFKNQAVIRLDIVESDMVSGIDFISRMEYFLVKTENGWRIYDRKLISEP